MKVSFENPDKINGLMTLVVEEADYKNEVEKTLKDYRKKANVPGFRPVRLPVCNLYHHCYRCYDFQRKQIGIKPANQILFHHFF